MNEFIDTYYQPDLAGTGGVDVIAGNSVPCIQCKRMLDLWYNDKGVGLKCSHCGFEKTYKPHE